MPLKPSVAEAGIDSDVEEDLDIGSSGQRFVLCALNHSSDESYSNTENMEEQIAAESYRESKKSVTPSKDFLAERYTLDYLT